ncbi:MAG: glycosyltransferase [Opitutales bacterium]|jgi:glycosyltransferase involved in cell wall biosynthesis
MNIAMFSNTYLPMLGGIEKSIATFAEDFRKRGHRCLVVTPEMRDAEESTEDVMRIPALKNIGGSAFSLHLPIPGLISAGMDDFAPDIVHAHHPFLMGDAALRIARRSGVPLVLTYHTLWDRYAGFFPNEVIKNIVVRLSVEYANVCDCVVAPSRSLENTIRAMGVESPVEVVPTGTDLALFRAGDRTRGRALLGLPGDVRVAGYVGRIGQEKNLAWLCKAATIWCGRDPDARFAVVGSGAYSKVLQKVFDEAGMGDRLVLPGAFFDMELADAYAALDVFAFASLSDTQGIVLAEAMASSLPVVALDAPGARESVSDGVNGVLLPTGSDCAAFAAALEHVFSDASRYESMCRASKGFSADYDRTLTARRMLDLYRSLIRNREDPFNDESAKLGTLERLRGRLEAEWELISTKAAATASAVTEMKHNGQ